jgi:class 3 adenylate cyclase
VADTSEPSPVSDAFSFKGLALALDYGVAVVEAESLEIVFENSKFFHWFPPDGIEPETLVRRVPDLNVERAQTRIERGRGYQFETKSDVDGRDEPLRVSIDSFDGLDAAGFLVQVQSISKEMEVQYMLDSYSRLAEKNAHELEKEKDRVEKLLLNIMPRAVVEELKEYGTATPQRFDAVSVLMLDFVGFTDMTISNDPSAIVSELNDIFSAFDRIAEMFGCERVKTIGDAYLAVSGLLEATEDHAGNIARVALRFRRYLERRNQAHSQHWIARIGINTGPIIGSLVGVQKYVYDIFGPGVNLAARMETVSEPMHITLTEDMMKVLRDDFVFTSVGEQEIKGFGVQNLYSLDGELSGRRF